jgi:hypothetical protein
MPPILPIHHSPSQPVTRGRNFGEAHDLTGVFPAIVYLPLEQNADLPVDEMTFFLRTAANPSGYAGAVREIVHQADPRIPMEGLSTQTAQIEHEIVSETLFARLCTAFALLSRWRLRAWDCTEPRHTPLQGVRARSEFAWHWGRTRNGSLCSASSIFFVRVASVVFGLAQLSKRCRMRFRQLI